VDRRERERILGEHQPRPMTERELREADRLAEDLEDTPLVGKPLPRRLRNWNASPEAYALAIAGPPAHARRLREIEDLIAGHEEELRRDWEELRRAEPNPDARARRWREYATRKSFYAVNDLIERHNRWYPVEARLPMDPRTGDFVKRGGQSYRLKPLDADWVLERFAA
jgi:hypothetical protein